jgi:hypothetical protein
MVLRPTYGRQRRFSLVQESAYFSVEQLEIHYPQLAE